jgi:YVTN family beta-propeller protein
MGVVVSPDGRHVFVSAGRGRFVAILDAEAMVLRQQISDVGARPWGIGLSRDGKYLYTANGPSNDVAVIDVAAGKVVRRVPVGASPWGIAVAP